MAVSSAALPGVMGHHNDCDGIVKKTYFDGTHRVRSPAETFDIVAPKFQKYRLTRLADVTGLDILDIPVVMAVRPLATTLTVSQGKGIDKASARVSAAMESIELWHAERAVPQAVLTDTPAGELDLPYAVRDLQQHAGSLLTDEALLDWIEGVEFATGRTVLVPREAVQMGRDISRDWRVWMLTASSNGLASGNTLAEATTHAIYEIIERDATSRLGRVGVHERTYIDPETVDDPHCRELLRRLHAADAWVEIVSAPNPFGVPCYVCYLWCPFFGGAMVVGSGAHSSSAVALSRAITEAAQSRVTFIVGTRDDISPLVYRMPNGRYRAPSLRASLISWPDVARCQDGLETDEAELQWATARLECGSRVSPIVVDLSTEPEFAVVRVIAPKTEYTARHEIPRPECGTEA
ncbi:MAG TPA: YcaO-like family protein [Mycobacteriales bacterium]|nr:YcaO-like family protein [Mycobacteriales bacterium]